LIFSHSPLMKGARGISTGIITYTELIVVTLSKKFSCPI